MFDLPCHLKIKSLSIKYIIIIPFLLQLTTVVVIIGFLCFKNGEKVINKLANDLLSEISSRVKEDLNSYTRFPININKFNAKAIKTGVIKLEKKQILLNHFANQISTSSPYLSGIFWGNNSGEFYAATLAKDGTIIKDFSNEENDYREPFFDYLKTLYPEKQPKLFDSRTRYWYKIALEKQKKTWTDRIYSSLSNDESKTLTNSYPIYDENNNLKGVLGVDIFLYRIDNFLKTIKVGKNGQIFLIDRSGLLISASTSKEPLTRNKNSLEETFNIKNTKDDLNRLAGKFLLEKFDNNLYKINKSEKLTFKFNKKKYFIRATPFKDEYGLDWLIVVVVPESDFMEQIYANTRNTIILCIIALIVAVIIGILTARWITKPILQINSAAKPLAGGNWSKKIRIDRFDELGQLARSFNTMASQLQQSFTTLEETNRTLEQKVLERTKQLSQTVELLKATQEKLIFENELLKDTSEQEYQYQIGGTVPIDSPTYVVRKADKLLYKALKQRQFCYIFNARQMGKSSLRAKIMHQLNSEGYVCAALDLTEILSNDTTEDQLYNSIIFNLAKKLGLFPEFNYRSWKKNLDYLSSLEKLGEFIEEILLKQISQKIVIFIDEIDTVLDLNFSCDRFFAFLRSLYNKRAETIEYNRLTLVLIGRTAPHYLIKNPESTPFNIGCGIPLEGFKLAEVERSLINGLRDNCDEPYTTIKEVLAWTGGQPFLTQKICNLIRESKLRVKGREESLFVEQLITKEIIDDWENKDEPEHLKTIRNKLTKNPGNSKLLLEKYREMLLKGEISDEQTIECSELFLSGIARKEAGKLKLYNRIYETVFDRSWVDKEIDLLSYRETVV